MGYGDIAPCINKAIGAVSGKAEEVKGRERCAPSASSLFNRAQRLQRSTLEFVDTGDPGDIQADIRPCRL